MEVEVCRRSIHDHGPSEKAVVGILTHEGDVVQARSCRIYELVEVYGIMGMYGC